MFITINKIWEFDGTNKVNLGHIGLVVGFAEALEIHLPYNHIVVVLDIVLCFSSFLFCLICE